jgi:hypothetical protein
MNPRGQLYKKEPLYQIVANNGNDAAIDLFRAELETVPWAVYRVRRIYQAKALYVGTGKTRRLAGYDPGKKGVARRCVERQADFETSADALQHLSDIAEQHSLDVHTLHDISYANVSTCGPTYPTTEEYYVAAPALVETKVRNGLASFDEDWNDVADPYCGPDDALLFS